MKKFTLPLITLLVIMYGTFCYGANPAEDLIFHFSFDEGNGNKASDSSPNKFEGDIKNGEWVVGIVGKALEFNNGAVTVPAFNVDEPDEMTIEMWFKPTEKINAGGRIDILYRLNGGGRPHITFNRGGVLFGSYLATKGIEFEVVSTLTTFEPIWYYFVVTQDKDKATMYFDGEVDSETNSGGDVRMDFGVHGMSIAANSGGSNYFNGTVDEVKMWSDALTADEIKRNMDQTLSVKAHDKLSTTWANIKSRK